MIRLPMKANVRLEFSRTFAIPGEDRESKENRHNEPRGRLAYGEGKSRGIEGDKDSCVRR